MAKKTAKKPARRSARSGAGGRIATTATTRRPSHIVVFKQPSETNTSTIVKALRLKERRGASVRAAVKVFETDEPGRVHSRIYERLGVAALDMSDPEASSMAREDAVALVLPNETRTIPEPREPLAEAPVPPDLTNPLVAYLAGMRDAAEMAMRFVSGSPLAPPGAEPPAPERRTRAPAERNASWTLDMIGMSADYDRLTGRGVTVAVLDTGIDLHHPDFAGRVVENDTAVSFVASESVQDGHGHGTHCAGVVGGPFVSDGARRYGVAPDVDLLIGKVLNDAGRGSDDQIIDAIDWAADRGARLISMSLGSARAVAGGFSQAYEQLARNLRVTAPGTLIVAAAGNESRRPSFVRPVGNPAACPSILAVGAVDKASTVAYFSCRRMDSIGEVNLSAPGVGVYSSWTNGSWSAISGTSMATPHVAGVAALYLEQSPELTPDELCRLMEAGALPLGDPDDYGAGLVQAP